MVVRLPHCEVTLSPTVLLAVVSCWVEWPEPREVRDCPSCCREAAFVTAVFTCWNQLLITWRAFCTLAGALFMELSTLARSWLT